jgi:hypothetical protein
MAGLCGTLQGRAIIVSVVLVVAFVSMYSAEFLKISSRKGDYYTTTPGNASSKVQDTAFYIAALEKVNKAQSRAAVNYEGCPDFDFARPVACFPRSPPPRPRECRHCSSQIHLSPGLNASTSITISAAIDQSCGRNASITLNFAAMDSDGPPSVHSLDTSNIVDATTSYRIKQYTSTSCMADDPSKCKGPKSQMKDEHLCHAHSFGTYVSDWFHHVTVEGLEPNMVYNVTIDPSPCNTDLLGSTGGSSWTFTTAPVPFDSHRKEPKSFDLKLLTMKTPEAPTDYEMKIAIVGDPGQDDEATATFRGIERMKDDLQLLILTGDVSYANRNHRLWDSWFTKYESLLMSLPMIVTPGNHDMEPDCCDWSIFKAYDNRFQMPEARPAKLGHACVLGDAAPKDYNFAGEYNYGNAFYSVIVGSAYFIVLNTYTDSSKRSPQYKWFKAELEKVDRSITPWLFIVAHGNIYETYYKHMEETGQIVMQEWMEPLFNKHKVNAFFAGHDHNYARIQPLGKYKPTYITIGNGGHSHHQQDRKKHDEEWLMAMDWWAWGFGTLTIVNETHSFWQTHFHNDTETEFVDGTDHVYILNHQTLNAKIETT